MQSRIITQSIWPTITEEVKKHPDKCFVSVAFFGKGGASMLPLEAGSTLVVNAGESIIRTGQTNPSELIKLLKKGVKIYSCSRLHAKIFVVNKALFIGSSNVSGNSDLRLQEAVLHTPDIKLVKQAKAAITGFCEIDLGMEQLKRLEKMYNPPKFVGGIPLGGNKRSVLNKSAKFYVCNLVYRSYPDDSDEVFEAGQNKAEKIKKDKNHQVLHFHWNRKSPFKIGDTVLQVAKDDDGVRFIYPPGTVIGMERFKKGHFIYLEAPNKRKRRLQSQASKIDINLVKRGGLKNPQTASKLFALWNK